MARASTFLVATGGTLIGLCLGLFLAPLIVSTAGAQITFAGLDENDDPQQRAQLYAALERDSAHLAQEQQVLKRVAKLVAPTVVHIEAHKTDRLSRRPGEADIEEAGSGVMVNFDEKFYVLTNRHVVRDTSTGRIDINLADGRQLHPLRVLEDPDTDVAVLPVAGSDLVSAKLGDSNQLEIGDFVLAVGSPFGLSHSVTYGIISAKGRRDLELGDEGVRLQDFLQTDAAINPGNSGGPLINLRGEVIGINTAIASNSGGNEGIGFSIPINMVHRVAAQLIEHGTVAKAFLGVNLEAKFNAEMAARLGLPRRQGALITSITANSPAAEAHLQPDDVVLAFDGVRVEDGDHLINMVNLCEVGRTVPLVVFRQKQTLTVNVTVGNRRTFLPATP
ncbi:MAG: trypsin-like peptidase domain-containing protein [Pirellulales bacterium]|nr:trypsin-like peptidase domain-containing protein [Pirellulales bacterium]